MELELVIRSILLGIGLAMDACAVSMANGLNEPKMKFNKMCLMALSFGLFQAMMPLVGYFVGHVALSIIEKFIPYIALIILSIIGVKMIIDGVKGEEEDVKHLTLKVLFIQSIATSIDALSVGFTIADYKVLDALLCAFIIAIMTFIICIGGCFIGKKAGTKLGSKAMILGGIILIGIGLEIFISGLFFK